MCQKDRWHTNCMEIFIFKTIIRNVDSVTSILGQDFFPLGYTFDKCDSLYKNAFHKEKFSKTSNIDKAKYRESKTLDYSAFGELLQFENSSRNGR